MKRDLARPEWQQRVGDRDAAQEAGMTMGEHRRELVQQVARRNVDTITQVKSIRYMQTYMPRCLACQHLEG